MKCNNKIIKKNGCIPYYKISSTDDPKFFRIDNNPYERIEYTQSFLIEEAIHFYNYGIGNHPFINKNIRHGFIKINEATFVNAIDELRIEYHESLSKNFHSLLIGKHSKQLLRKNLFPNCKKEFFSSKSVSVVKPGNAEDGIFAVRTFVTDEWRNLALVNKRINTSCRIQVKSQYRKLDKASQFLIDLRKFISLNNIEKYISEYVIRPFWGGNQMIIPDLDNSPKGITFDMNGICVNTTENIGLTEKLYCAYASEFFHKKGKKVSSKKCKRNGFIFLEYIEKKVSEASEILPFGVYDKNNIWRKWFRSLDLLALHFDVAINNKKGMRSISDNTIGEKVGLPWALILIGVLKVYLLDLMIRTLMGSLPIYRIYNEYNGNAGIALLEALSPNANNKLTYPCIDRDGYRPKVKSILSDWKEFLVGNNNDPWGINQSFQLMFENQIIKSIKKNERTKKNEIAEAISIDDFINNEIYIFPTINNDFYKKTHLVKARNSPLNFGMRYFVQAHLYVAGVLLERARKIVGIENSKDFRGGNNFTLRCSSLFWGF